VLGIKGKSQIRRVFVVCYCSTAWLVFFVVLRQNISIILWFLCSDDRASRYNLCK